jgi:hypothetical protein
LTDTESVESTSMEIRDLALYVGLALGSLMVVTACAVYAWKQQFGSSGMALVGAGVVLVGMSVWSATTIKVSKEGIEIITQVKEDVAKLAEANKTVSTELSKVVRKQEAASEQTDELAQVVKQQAPAAASRLERSELRMRELPKANREQLESLSKGLQLRSAARQ